VVVAWLEPETASALAAVAVGVVVESELPTKGL